MSTSRDAARWAMVEQLHRSPWKVALVAAGAGSEAVECLLNHPGASNTVLDAQVPYSPAAMRRYAPGIRCGAVSEDAARVLAVRARTIAEALSGPDEPVAGVSCTAALATSRERRGDEHGFISISTRGRLVTIHVLFQKGERDRAVQEHWISHVLLDSIGELAGIQPVTSDEAPDFEIERSRIDAASPLDGFWGGGVDAVVIERDGRVLSAQAEIPALLPGSFDPLHRGHTRLAAVAERILGCPVRLELSVQNVDKEELNRRDVDRRLQHIVRGRSVVLTRAPMFIDKARRFPNCCFVLGYDTAIRLMDGSYYGGDEHVEAVLDEVRRLGCRFLIAGREQGGVFQPWDSRRTPDSFQDLFEPIPEDAFRVDIRAESIRAAWRSHRTPA